MFGPAILRIGDHRIFQRIRSSETARAAVDSGIGMERPGSFLPGPRRGNKTLNNQSSVPNSSSAGTYSEPRAFCDALLAGIVPVGAYLCTKANVSRKTIGATQSIG